MLFFVFIAAVIFYFIAAQNTMEKEETVYTSMGQARLPVVYAVMNGKPVNCMHGYLQDRENEEARSSITLVPENRALEISIAEYGNTVTEMQYEIRDLSMDRLVENTQVESWSQGDDGKITAVLPIQNLIEKEEPYLLTLTLRTGEQEIHYYTRIMWSDYGYGGDFIRLSEEFSRKSLDYESARDLVSYLETDPSEDNSSLGTTTIRTSFDHLTWDGLDVEMEGDPMVTLKELDGTMGQVQVDYQVRLRDESGKIRRLNVEDYYTMRWNEQRIYMMNYTRTANEIFSSTEPEISGRRIMLGIANDSSVGSRKSPNGRYTAFKVNGEVWCYGSEEEELLKLFSFADEEDDWIRSGYRQHDVKLLSAEDNGDVYFLVYGYMNRGPSEGQVGAALYHYRSNSDTLQENMFIPAVESFDVLQWEIGQLAYLNENGMLYLMLNQSIYGIDLTSNELVVAASGLSHGQYAVSENQQRIAWKEMENTNQNDRIHVMDLNTAQKTEITAENEDRLHVLGFVGSDLIYGASRQEDVWISNGRVRDLPMYAIYIVDTQMEVESQYQEEGIYITDVSVRDGRIHLSRMIQVSGGNYVFQDYDTIVCNEDTEVDALEGIGWYASQDMGKRYFVELSQAPENQLAVREPASFSYENEGGTAAVLERESRGDVMFYAYAQGQFLGCSDQFQEAVELAYDGMGLVTDEDQRIIWDRINRRGAAAVSSEENSTLMRHLSQFEENTVYDDGFLMIDARGCSLSQMLYFVDKGYPVAAYTDRGLELITAYDAYNITLTDPSNGESIKMGLQDGTAYFESMGNDFLCGRMIR